jgi:hypothetical protein
LLVKKIKYILLLSLLFFTEMGQVLLAQPGPPGGPPGGPGGPGCWPPSTCEVPINNELVFLLIAGILLAIYYYKKSESNLKDSKIS